MPPVFTAACVILPLELTDIAIWTFSGGAGLLGAEGATLNVPGKENVPGTRDVPVALTTPEAACLVPLTGPTPETPTRFAIESYVTAGHPPKRTMLVAV